MNINGEGLGGASIIPSARRSIHSHRPCPSAYTDAMVSYGLKDNNKREAKKLNENQANRSNEQGTDEVDNIWSKPAQSISPSSFPSKNKLNNRRNSYDENLEDTQEDTDILSKSLPATLPSHSYYSDFSDDDIPTRIENSDISYHSATRGTPQTNRSLPGSHQTSPLANTSDINRSRSTYQKDFPETTLSSRWTLPLMALLLGVLVYAMMHNKTILTNKIIYDKSRFYNDIDILGNKYRIDDNSVLRMQTGIATIFERQDAGSFMFIYNSSDGKFNKKAFNTFINDVSITASKYLRNESTPVDYTMVEGSTLDLDGHGELISRFREDLHRTGVMLVTHVEAIPSALAMAFHYYCDEYNPLVKKSAIFFTLNLAKCSVSADKRSIHAVIEKCLAQKWQGVPPDSIGPLLTRVVSVVIDLTTAF